MNVIEKLSEELQALVSGNELYDSYKKIWRYLLESYMGGDEYRSAGHLTRYTLETDAEYQARLRATPLDNHCQSVISVYNSFLFREEPDREFDYIFDMPELKDFLKDADLEGRSLNSFMKDVSTWASVFGHCWIIISKPNLGAVTRADEQAMGVRPYVSLLTPMVVLDWSWYRAPNGRYELDYLRYVEDVNGDVRVIKEWTPELIKTSKVHLSKGVIEEQIVEENQLGMIPAVIAYNGRSVVRGIGVSDIADIADMQKFIYNATSEIDQSIRLDSHPSLVKSPDTIAGVGAGAIIHMPENLDPGLKPYVLDFGGADTNNILSAIRHAIESIDKMANTGAVRAVESRTMSGVAMETEFQLLNARLSEKADNLELAEEQMWKIWCKYMGVEWYGEIEYPGSFNLRDTGREIEQLQIAANTNPADPRVKAAIDMKILDWLDLDEDELKAIVDTRIVNPDTVQEADEYTEFEPHEMTDPVTGETRMITSREDHIVLANQGWIHKY